MTSDENALIRLDSVTRSYGYGEAESFALKDFSLEVRRGEFIMIMGPSGCGKTTLLNVIGLLDRPTSGRYYLNGTPIEKYSSRKKAALRSRKIGYIFQNFNLINNLPVIENVALPLIYSGMGKTRRLKRASEMLATFHLEEREYFLPYQLSGGQQQRVCIARSLVNHPEIILADEPTGNLDSRSSHIVMEELRQIHSEGNTIIMVTHNPQLTTYATRVIHMLDGQIDVDIKTVSDEDLPQFEPEELPKEEVSEEPKSESNTSEETLRRTASNVSEEPRNDRQEYQNQASLSSDTTQRKARSAYGRDEAGSEEVVASDFVPTPKPAPLGEISTEPVIHRARDLSFPVVGSEFVDRSVKPAIHPVEDPKKNRKRKVKKNVS